MVFIQELEIGDLNGSVIWELAITSNYQELFESSDKRKIDIIDFGDVKIDGEELTLRQKEDEFDFSAFESRIDSDNDLQAMNLLKSSQYSDVFIALFEHEPISINDARVSLNPLRRKFSGMIRRKASAQDVIWRGASWESEPNPLRDWKFTAQALGEALIDNVKLASELDGNGNIVKGACALAQITPIDLAIDSFVYSTKTTHYSLHGTFKRAVRFSDALRALLEVARQKISASIPDVKFTCNYAKLPYYYAYATGSQWNADQKYYDLILKTTQFEIFGDDPKKDFYIDSELIKYPTESDGYTPKLNYNLAWHRFENLTTLLYKLAICLGCRLRIEHASQSEFIINFSPIETKDKTVSIYDATKASIDISEASITENDAFHCQATDFCNEGFSMCKVESGQIVSDDDLSKNSNPLPLSIAETNQYTSRKGERGDVLQNVDDARGVLTSTRAAWTGILTLKDESLNTYDIIRRVGASIDNSFNWYSKLSDLLNLKVKNNQTFYKTEYSLEIPYIKGFKSSANATPSLDNLELFSNITLDGKTYKIISISIKPTDGNISIKMTNSSRYGFSQPTAPPIYGRVALSETTAEDYIDNSEVGSFIANSDIKKNDYLRIMTNGQVAKVTLNSEYAWEYGCGVALNDAKAGESVFVKNSGYVESPTALKPGANVYYRFVDYDVYAFTPNRAKSRVTGKELVDLKVGRAISANRFLLTEPKGYILQQ